MRQSKHAAPAPIEYMSRAEVAAIFQVAPSTVTRWADEGKLTCIRTLGGHRRYAREGVVRLVHMLTKEEDGVETITLEVPKMYGDHHTSAVHQALAPLPGVSKVWASAASRKVQVTFDPAVVTPAAIAAQLARAGYPVYDGAEAAASAPQPKDPAWSESELRMTQTYTNRVKA